MGKLIVAFRNFANSVTREKDYSGSVEGTIKQSIRHEIRIKEFDVYGFIHLVTTLTCEGVPAAACSNGLSKFQHTITITRTYSCTLQFVLLMMGANSTRNMYSKYSVIKNT
jgi:hypothetical protein